MEYSSRTLYAKALFTAYLVVLFLGCNSPSPLTQYPAPTPNESLLHTFIELFGDSDLSTRLEAYFLSVGLPDQSELAQILRRRSTEAEPLERIVAVYALAAMTREAGDIGAFLDALPTEPQLFFELMETEWKLSGTMNTGIADLLLLLAYEPHTRSKALPHLVRIARNMPGELESMKTYFDDPLILPYIDIYWDSASLDNASLNNRPAHSIEKTDTCTAAIIALIRHGDMTAQVTAMLMTERMWKSEELMEIQRSFRRELPADSMYSYLLKFNILDDASFSNLLSSDPGMIAKLLHTEKVLYRPPLKGIVGALWYEFSLDDAIRAHLRTDGEIGIWARQAFDEKKRTRLLKILEAVWQYGKDWLEACDVNRLMRYTQENKAGNNLQFFLQTFRVEYKAQPNRRRICMSTTFTIPMPEGDLCITLETLAAIRQKLLEALKQKQPLEDYIHLIREIESGNAAPIILEDGASIGGWKLIYRNSRLLLERQQMPRTPLMLFHEACLEWREGQWQVLSIDIKKVRGR